MIPNASRLGAAAGNVPCSCLCRMWLCFKQERLLPHLDGAVAGCCDSSHEIKYSLGRYPNQNQHLVRRLNVHTWRMHFGVHVMAGVCSIGARVCVVMRSVEFECV